MAIFEHHLKEWVEGSGVDEAIALLNVESLDDPREIDQRLNLNSDKDKRWQHWQHGPGWCVSGVDPNSGERSLFGVQFKPDTPVQFEGDKKPRKYIGSKGYDTAPLFLAHPDSEYWQKILSDVTQPLLITEGAKKAGSAMSAGVPCISLPGVACGQKGDRLKPKLKQFCVLGRRVYLGFDSDQFSNPNVYRELDRLGRLITQEGCVVYVLCLPPDQKGLDDYLVANGRESLNSLIESAATFAEWRKNNKPEVKPKADSEYEGFGQLDPKDEVLNTTIDDHLFKRLFGSGKGDYITLDDAFYQYTDQGYWAPIDDKQIRRSIAEQCRTSYRVRRSSKGEVLNVDFPFARDANVKSAFNFCRSLLDAGHKLPSNKHLRCFANGTVDLRTGQLIEHDADHFLTGAIAAEYVPNQSCPEVFLEFIDAAYGLDLLEVIQAVTSMFLDPTAPYGKFPHLLGASGSGKGTLLRLWMEMFGTESSRGGSSFADLATPETRHQNLTGCSLFVLGDVGGYLQGLKAFYELVDNAPMSGRALFSASGYQKQWNVRFAIASVDHLQIENSGDGWDRRVIPIPTKPRRGNMDPYLGTKLADVKGQIISWALSMSRDRRDWVLNNLHLFDRISSAKSDASVSGDPVRLFVDMCLRPDPGSENVHSYQLQSWYEAFCTAYGYQRMGLSRFISHLKTIIPSHFKPQRRALADEDPNRTIIPAHWVDIRAIDDAFEPINELSQDTFRCNRRKCREGGLILFSEFTTNLINPAYANGSGGSTTLIREKYVPDPCDPQAQSGSQQNGLGGSGGSGTFSDFGKTQKNLVTQITNNGKSDPDHKKKPDLIRNPPSLPDPPDPPDPNFQNPLLEGGSRGSGTFNSLTRDSDPPDPDIVSTISFDYESWEELDD